MSIPAPDGGPLPEHLDLLFSFVDAGSAQQAIESLTELAIDASRSDRARRPGDGVLVDVVAPVWQFEQVRRVVKIFDPDVREYVVG